MGVCENIREIYCKRFIVKYDFSHIFEVLIKREEAPLLT
jgi:hypothetical protein